MISLLIVALILLFKSTAAATTSNYNNTKTNSDENNKNNDTLKISQFLQVTKSVIDSSAVLNMSCWGDDYGGSRDDFLRNR